MTFYVGQRVIYEGYHEDLAGHYGTVVVLKKSLIGVKFDNFTLGHDLNGNCSGCAGWWCERQNLIAVDSPIIGLEEII